MTFRTLTIEEFNKFQENHELTNYFQTINYALLMAENGYDYEIVGLVDDANNEVKGASIILLKPIGIKCFYGYAPHGFLIDYNDTNLLEEFTQKIKDYFYEKSVIFIKVNPNIITGEIDYRDFETSYNENKRLVDILKELGYKKLKDNLYFESKLPRFNAIIDLNRFNIFDVEKNTRNKIKKGIRKGLKFEKATKNELYEFYDLIKHKENHNQYFYQDLYTVFQKEEKVDLFLIKINYEEFLLNSQYIYNEESNKNSVINDKLAEYSSNKIINKKMTSDKNLLSYKNDIMEATKGLSDKKDVVIAGALVVRHQDTAYIINSGYDNSYKRFAANYFLHYNLIKHYQNECKFLDLNGIVGDFKGENNYSGLNRFKLGFKPSLYEYIGEFDLIIEPRSYEILLSNGILSKEFNKNKKEKV